MATLTLFRAFKMENEQNYSQGIKAVMLKRKCLSDQQATSKPFSDFRIKSVTFRNRQTWQTQNDWPDVQRWENTAGSECLSEAHRTISIMFQMHATLGMPLRKSCENTFGVIPIWKNQMHQDYKDSQNADLLERDGRGRVILPEGIHFFDKCWPFGKGKLVQPTYKVPANQKYVFLVSIIGCLILTVQLTLTLEGCFHTDMKLGVSSMRKISILTLCCKYHG